MTEVAVNYLVERLLDLGRENVELIVGVQDDIDDLVGELRGLKAFLEDASKINRDTASWKRSLKEIRSVVYKAEDTVDKFLVEAKQHQDKNRAAQLMDVSYLINVRNVAKEVKSIIENVKKVNVKHQQLLQEAKLDIQSTTIPQPIQQILSEDDDVVGFDEEAKTVIDRLIGGSKDLESVPVVGMAGLGKSTLARKVYKDPRIKYEFFTCAWVNVSQTNNKKDVLQNILTELKKQKSEVENKNENQLIEAICSCLEKGGRSLIVLDDVWKGDVMEFVRPIFPKNSGHRIMMTTRLEDVASHFSKNIHKLNFLSDYHSFVLLNKKVSRTESCQSEFEKPARSIAEKCKGLPLAIVVIAGALIACKTKREWHLVDQNIGEHLIDRNKPDSCLRFVRMSYDLLSYETKACFLYCAIFPRGFEIPASKLIRLWIAEGFINHGKSLTIEEISENCLNDLSKKNLLMVMERTSDGQIKTCRIHDMLYEFCKQEASEEDLYKEAMAAPDQSSPVIQDSDTCRRLCVGSLILYDFLSSFSKKPMPLVRSFLCFSPKQMEKSSNAMRNIPKVFPLIKILDIGSTKVNFGKDFYQLLHLKYVSLFVDYKSLPEPYGNFWNLETLIINTTSQESTFEVKANIWSMLRLRHLHTNVPAILPSPKEKNSKDCCLQTLSMIAPQSCTKKVFAKARYLRKLGIRGNVVALLDANSGSLGDFSELKHLENLKFLNDGQHTGRITTLPKLVFIFSKTLRKLTFSGTGLEWSEMTKLGQLESLEVLKLKENAFKGEFWEPEIGVRFSSLLVLWIERTDLRTWRASSHNFPCLKRLVLITCEKLEEIPVSLADIGNLQEMTLNHTHTEAVIIAKEIREKKQKRETEKKEQEAEAQKKHGEALESSTSTSVGFKLSIFPPE